MPSEINVTVGTEDYTVDGDDFQENRLGENILINHLVMITS